MRKVIYLLLLLVSLAGCKSSKMAISENAPKAPRFLSSKLQLTIPTGAGSTASAGGTMKIKGGERIQLSILMPVLRIEMARLEITPDEVLLIDRMNKRYVKVSRNELNEILPTEVSFDKLEKLLWSASLPGGKTEVSGRELGIPSLEKAKIKLSDFSSQEFIMAPTELSDKYRQVPLEQLIIMLDEL